MKLHVGDPIRGNKNACAF